MTDHGLVIGLGARPGVRAEDVRATVDALLSRLAPVPVTVRAYATVDARADEPGLRAVAGPALLAYPPHVLAGVPVPNPSPLAAAAVGTPSVAEAAALHAATQLAAPGAVVELVGEKLAGPAVTAAAARIVEPLRTAAQPATRPRNEGAEPRSTAGYSHVRRRVRRRPRVEGIGEMADKQRPGDRGPVDEGNGGPVAPGAAPPRGGAHGTGGNGVGGPPALARGSDVEAQAATKTIKRTRMSGLWVGVTLSAVVLMFLLIFIVQNIEPTRIRFLGTEGTLPIGVALLFAAALGVLLVAIPGYLRILQLRRLARKRDQH